MIITYRQLEAADAPLLWDFLNTLDTETNRMMLEPGEREERTDLNALTEDIRHNVNDDGDYLQAAFADDKIVGYIRAERGRFNRNMHCVSVVTGILKEFTGRGIGTMFFNDLEQWARVHGIRRMELTVECHNKPAINLYKRAVSLPRASGRIPCASMIYTSDEYYMAKIVRNR